MKRWRFIGTGILAIGTLASAAWAAQPSKGDMDFCNQKAAQVSKATPVQARNRAHASAVPSVGDQPDRWAHHRQ